MNTVAADAAAAAARRGGGSGHFGGDQDTRRIRSRSWQAWGLRGDSGGRTFGRKGGIDSSSGRVDGR